MPLGHGVGGDALGMPAQACDNWCTSRHVFIGLLMAVLFACSAGWGGWSLRSCVLFLAFLTVLHT